jgi:hypothetical protein
MGTELRYISTEKQVHITQLVALLSFSTQCTCSTASILTK